MVGIDREPVVSGTFYSSDPKELIHQLESCFKEYKDHSIDDISALIVPHAGYTYSGKVAACAYSLLNRDAQYDNIFIIGSSHHTAFNGASIYNKGHYKTPLGITPVNLELTEKLIQKSDYFTYNKAAHEEEHTIEVQLPFLQYQLKQLSPIVPIILGVREYEKCKNIAEILKPYFNENNLFIISTDFSHYPSDEDARVYDKFTANAICSNKPDKLIKTLRDNEKQNISNLYTSLCGWSSVLTLMHLTQEADTYRYSKVKYMTSGEAVFHDLNKVVGYQSILVQKIKKEEPVISESSKKTLLKACHKAIESYLNIDSESEAITDVDILNCNSAFVSVYVSEKLRGCIGQFNSGQSLTNLVEYLAIAAAFNDSRFEIIKAEELNDLKVEISLLTPQKKINHINEIVLGKHGVTLEKDNQKGTFLPQVATRTGWNLEEFLGHLSKDKAHIGWDGWKGADIYTFEAIIISD